MCLFFNVFSSMPALYSVPTSLSKSIYACS